MIWEGIAADLAGDLANSLGSSIGKALGLGGGKGKGKDDQIHKLKGKTLDQAKAQQQTNWKLLNEQLHPARLEWSNCTGQPAPYADLDQPIPWNYPGGGKIEKQLANAQAELQRQIDLGNKLQAAINDLKADTERIKQTIKARESGGFLASISNIPATLSQDLSKSPGKTMLALALALAVPLAAWYAFKEYR